MILILLIVAASSACVSEPNLAPESKTAGETQPASVFDYESFVSGAWEALAAEARTMSEEELRRRLAAEADPNLRGQVGMTPLIALVRYTEEPALVQLLLDAGADPAARSDYGDSAVDAVFFQPLSPERLEILRLLLQAGGEPNGVGGSEYGPWPPLIWAIATAGFRGEEPSLRLRSVQLLIDAGANINTTAWGLPALTWAVTNDGPIPQIARLLIAAGADVSRRSINGHTVLMYAVASTSKNVPTRPYPPFYTQSPEVVRLLLEAGAEVDARSPDGWTALMIAAAHRDEAFVDALLEAGAEVTLSNHAGATAYDLALDNEGLRGSDILRRLHPE